MRRFIAKLSFMVACLGLAGCSAYPLPEDATGFSSESIATVIRCQARRAVRDLLVDTVAAYGDALVYEGRSGESVAAALRSGSLKFSDIQWRDFAPKPSRLLSFYANTLVSYDFTIDSSEMNAAGVSVSLLGLLNKGSNSFALRAANDRTRQVKRHFRVFDDWDSLARKMPDAFCAGVPREANLLYPATGLLRIDSLVRTFARQNQLGNIVSGDGNDFATAEMADTLIFTTKTTGNIDPAFTRAGVVGSYVPAPVSLNSDNYRQDVHTIIILLRLPADTKKLPRFDEIGLLTLSPAQRQRAAASAGLDRTKTNNLITDINQLTTDERKLSP